MYTFFWATLYNSHGSPCSKGYVQQNGDSTPLYAGSNAICVAALCFNLCSCKNLWIVSAKCNSAQAQRNSRLWFLGVMTPYRFAYGYQRFGETTSLHLQNICGIRRDLANEDRNTVDSGNESPKEALNIQASLISICWHKGV